MYGSLQIPTNNWSTANSDPCLVMPGAEVCLESVSVISRDLEIQCKRRKADEKGTGWDP